MNNYEVNHTETIKFDTSNIVTERFEIQGDYINISFPKQSRKGQWINAVVNGKYKFGVKLTCKRTDIDGMKEMVKEVYASWLITEKAEQKKADKCGYRIVSVHAPIDTQVDLFESNPLVVKVDTKEGRWMLSMRVDGSLGANHLFNYEPTKSPAFIKEIQDIVKTAAFPDYILENVLDSIIDTRCYMPQRFRDEGYNLDDRAVGENWNRMNKMQRLVCLVDEFNRH